MFKFKFYFWNAFWSSLIGLAAYIAMMFFYGWRYYSVIDLITSMITGIIIGTVSLFFIFQIFIKLKRRPLVGFLSNFLVVAFLCIAGSVIAGLRSYQLFVKYFLSSSWFLALIVSEILSFFLTYAWYRRIMLYQEKLELKKASLKCEDAP